MTSGRVGLEVSSLLVPSPSGVAVFGCALLERLREVRGDTGLTLHYRAGRCALRDRLPDGLESSGYLTGLFLSSRIDLLHTLDTRAPALYRGRLLATVFDVLSALPIAAELDLAPPRFRGNKLAQYRRIAERASLVVSISEDTKRRFEEFTGYRGRHEVVHPGIAPDFLADDDSSARAERLSRLGLHGREYVLFVGELCRKKNVEAVIDVFRRLAETRRGLELVLVGRPSYGWDGSEAARALGARPRGVHRLGFVAREDLLALYGGARLLLFPSHYEGFGLPVVEAMARGVPVVASNRGGIPEAAGDAARLADADDVDALTDLAAEVLDSPGLAAELARRGREQAVKFSWERAARAVSALYDELAG